MNGKWEWLTSVINGHEQYFPFILNHFSLNHDNVRITYHVLKMSFTLVHAPEISLTYCYLLFMFVFSENEWDTLLIKVYYCSILAISFIFNTTASLCNKTIFKGNKNLSCSCLLSLLVGQNYLECLYLASFFTATL